MRADYPLEAEEMMVETHDRGGRVQHLNPPAPHSNPAFLAESDAIAVMPEHQSERQQ